MKHATLSLWKGTDDFKKCFNESFQMEAKKTSRRGTEGGNPSIELTADISAHD